VGNTTKAVTKGYAIGSAGLARWCCSPTTRTRWSAGKNVSFDLSNHMVIIGCSSAADAVSLRRDGDGSRRPRRRLGGGRSAPPVQEIKGIMEGTAKPEYGARSTC
jgi:K(+)-stimulated pyrophosphate-energized sodium pump